MSTNKKSSKTNTGNAAPAKTAAKKAVATKKTAASKTADAAPKKKPGRPKKQTSSPTVKAKPAAISQDSQAQSALKNIQKPAVVLPSATTTTSASGSTPKVNINLSWQQKAPIGKFARLLKLFQRKK